MITVELVNVLKANKKTLKQVRRVYDWSGIKKEDLEILGWVSREALEADNDWTHILIKRQDDYMLLETRSIMAVEKGWGVKLQQIFVV